MKKTTLVAFLLCTTHFMYCQATIPASGGEATGTTGSASYTVGQLITTTTINSNGSVSAGVQQAFEISVTLGIEDTTINLTFAAYPNPTVDVLHLSISNFNQENLSYSLFNVQGQLLATKQVNNTTTTIGMQSYAPAVYFLKVTSNNQELKTFKIIKN